MKRILITGICGYIGSNLKKYLLTRDYEVIGIDRKINIWADTVSKEYIRAMKPQVIVHLAAMPGISQCDKDIKLAITDNIMTTENIFRCVEGCGIPVIFTSSQAVKSPQNNYAVLKCTCEQIVQKYYGNILRLSNVYGGDDYLTKKTSVIANFLNAKNNNQPIYIHGNGNQTRDFIHVDEVCRAIELCFGKYNMLLDIGTGIPRSINEVVGMLNYDNIKYIPGKPGVSSGTADIIKAKEVIGFEAVDKLEQYLRMSVNSHT